MWPWKPFKKKGLFFPKQVTRTSFLSLVAATYRRERSGNYNDPAGTGRGKTIKQPAIFQGFFVHLWKNFL